jgi:hypothetical protein
MARMRDAHAARATLASALPFLFSPAGRIRRLLQHIRDEAEKAHR